MKRSRKIALALFVLFIVTNIVWSVCVEVFEVREQLGYASIRLMATEKARLMSTTILMILYFIPLTFLTKKYADSAEIGWLRKAVKWYLPIAVLCTAAGILYLIFG